jgi:hypothetical protein
VLANLNRRAFQTIIRRYRERGGERERERERERESSGILKQEGVSNNHHRIKRDRTSKSFAINGPRQHTFTHTLTYTHGIHSLLGHILI